MALQRAVLLASLLVEVASRSSGSAVSTQHVARGLFTQGLALPPLGATLVPAPEMLAVPTARVRGACASGRAADAQPRPWHPLHSAC